MYGVVILAESYDLHCCVHVVIKTSVFEGGCSSVVLAQVLEPLYECSAWLHVQVLLPLTSVLCLHFQLLIPTIFLKKKWPQVFISNPFNWETALVSLLGVFAPAKPLAKLNYEFCPLMRSASKGTWLQPIIITGYETMIACLPRQLPFWSPVPCVAEPFCPWLIGVAEFPSCRVCVAMNSRTNWFFRAVTAWISACTDPH